MMKRITAVCCLVARVAMVATSATLPFAAWADTSFKAGEWAVDFKADGARLELAHAASGARIAGVLAFTGPSRAGDRAPDGTVVCGSLFLAGEVLERLGALPNPEGHFVPNETFGNLTDNRVNTGL